MSLKGLEKEGVFDLLGLAGRKFFCPVEPHFHRLLVCEFAGIDI